MNDAVKNVVRQISPPILIDLARTIFQREKQTALKTQHEHRNRSARQNEIILRESLVLKLHPASRHGFEYFCYRSPDCVEEMDIFIQQTRDKSRLLDIGALHGIFSLAFTVGHPDKRVVAVDASPVAFARLLYNIHKNGLRNVTPVECAMSDSPGELRMHYEWEHAVAAEVRDSGQSFLTVEKRTGDDLCQSLSFAPDAIKIDVEGHEVKVLKGLSHVIERHRPLIFLELHPTRISDEKDSIEDMLNYLAAKRYRITSMDSRNLPIHDAGQLTQLQRLLLIPS